MMENDVRKDHFAYFQGMGYPYVGVTVHVEITDWLAAVKAAGRSVIPLIAGSDGEERCFVWKRLRV